MSERGTLSDITGELCLAFEPLDYAARNGLEGLVGLLQSAGLEVADDLQRANAVLTTLVEVYKKARQVLEGGSLSAADAKALLNQARSLVEGVRELVEAARGTSGQGVAEGTRRLLDYLIIEYLRLHRWPIYTGLLTLGLIEERDPLGGRPYWRLYEDRLMLWLSSPKEAFSQAYGWGTDDFQARLFLERLGRFLLATGFTVSRELIDAEAEALGASSGSTEFNGLRVPLAYFEREGLTSSVGLRAFPLPGEGGQKPGLGVSPYGAGALTFKQDLGDSWSLAVRGAVDATSPYGLVLRPGRFQLGGLRSGAPPSEVSTDVFVTRSAPKGQRRVLLSDPAIGRLEVGSVGVAARITADSTGKENDLAVELPVHDLAVVIDPKERDGLLAKLLPEKGIEASFDLTFGWSARRGPYFKGSAGLALDIPVNQTLAGGAIEAKTAHLAIGLEEGTIPVTVAVTGSATLGPFTVALEKFGLQARVSFPAGGGNVGPAQIDLGFKNPDGAGLGLNTDIVSGGGYLSHDAASGRYAGLLNLSFYDKVAITAVGILSTRKPDGSPGFSLLIVISGEFPPIQLGYGFTLNGLGGLIGLNRTMSVPALQDGVRSGGLSSVMFPDDPIRNAPRIISDLQTFFPEAEGRTLLGPMAMIGWGTPTLLRAQVAFLIELPAPVKLALLGSMRLALPTEELALVQLRSDFLGALDLERGLLSIDASLVDSHITGLPLTGDAALRLRWLGRPDFALSAGGFHPSARPPEGFPALRRLGIALTTGNNPRLTLESYLAVTSNSVQFGAHLDLYVQVTKLKASGHFGFDTLLQFSPFRFLAEMSAYVAVEVFGFDATTVRLNLKLTGPNPWHARGHASFSLLCFDYSVDVDVTIGRPRSEPTPATIDLVGEVRQGLAQDSSWSVKPPAGSDVPAIPCGDPKLATNLVMHPLASLEVVQKVAPLGVRVDKIGSRRIKGAAVVGLPTVTVKGGGQLVSAYTEARGESFAPGQYFDMSDAEKLARPSFEDYDAGIVVRPEKLSRGAARTSDVGYVTEIQDPSLSAGSVKLTFRKLPMAELHEAVKRGAVAEAARLRGGAGRYRVRGPAVRVSAPAWKVATRDGVTLPAEVAVPAGSVQALVSAARLASGHRFEDIQVVRDFEVVK